MSDRRDADSGPDSERVDEIADAAEDLARSLRDLRGEIEDDRRRGRGDRRPRRRRDRRDRRGPLGLPRPPSPREVLQFADEFAIPALIALLEANIKLLEGVRAVLRAAEGVDRARDRGAGARDRAADVRDTTLDRLEDALGDLQTALREGPLPDDGTAGDLLTDVREVRRRIDDEMRESRDRAASIEVDREDDDPEGGVEIDVDAELESIREQHADDEDDGDDGDDTDDDPTGP